MANRNYVRCQVLVSSIFQFPYIFFFFFCLNVLYSIVWKTKPLNLILSKFIQCYGVIPSLLFIHPGYLLRGTRYSIKICTLNFSVTCIPVMQTFLLILRICRPDSKFLFILLVFYNYYSIIIN